VNIARSLKGKVPWIGKITRTGTKLDMVGVDILIYIRPLIVHTDRKTHRNDIKVPIQVKSSMVGLRKYYEKHPQKVDAGVIVIVVNDDHTDLEIQSQLLGRLEYIREAGNDFCDFFKELRLLCSTIDIYKRRINVPAVIHTVS